MTDRPATKHSLSEFHPALGVLLEGGRMIQVTSIPAGVHLLYYRSPNLGFAAEGPTFEQALANLTTRLTGLGLLGEPLATAGEQPHDPR